MKTEYRLLSIVATLEALATMDLLSTPARENLRSASMLICELARYDGTQFDTPRLMHAVNNVRNNQA